MKKINGTQHLDGGINRYDGEHFGDVIWSELPTDFAEKKPRFYVSEAQKTDFNAFFKVNYAFSPILNGYFDVQYRHVTHNTEGSDRRKIPFNHDLIWRFFNPKIGLVVENSERSRFHASFAVAHREPNRNDILDVLTGVVPSSEQLLNTELGWQGAFKSLNLSINFYQMYYNNQLVVTGKINDVGEQVRTNVPKSYRAGVELSAEWQIFNRLSLDYNLTLSQNKVLNFKELRDNFDTFIQDKIEHGTTDIAFSPNVVANAILTYKIFEKEKAGFDVALVGKHVGGEQQGVEHRIVEGDARLLLALGQEGHVEG
ncbi:MAG: TonB-dependent receptor, partial [Saprospiraceae bacterium]|nr:TonB-dependent receptor [Saprospiraceae bacterium]